jgi:type IX secretion system PorP/SprF family membrane protein
MYKYIILLTTLLILTSATFESQGQDASFSQFYANPLYLNPALAGANVCPRLILNYRNQWPSISKGYVTYNASYDQYVDKLHGGIGILVNSDNAGNGILRTNTASLMYAYKFQAGKKLYFSLAAQATFHQRSLGWDKLQFEDQIDDQLGFVNPTGEQPPDNQSVVFPDFSTGAAFMYGGKLYGGVAVHHLTQPNMAFYTSSESPLPMKMTGHLGYNIDLGGSQMGMDEDLSDFYLSLNGLYQQQGEFHQLNAGVYLNKYPLVVGAWFRHNFENADAVIALVGLQWENIKVGYSYDYTLSELQGNSGGAHEVSFAWQFNCIEKRRKIRAIKCPQF